MKNIFGPWLTSLRKPIGPAPKAIPDHQFYMSHPLYRDKVTAEYNALYPHSGNNAIKDQNSVATVLLRKEPVEVQEALRREAVEELRVARKKHEEARTGLPSDIPEDIETCVASSYLLFSPY
jgi:hypothetical protein